VKNWFWKRIAEEGWITDEWWKNGLRRESPTKGEKWIPKVIANEGWKFNSEGNHHRRLKNSFRRESPSKGDKINSKG
jgi:hypothetical protein